MPGVGIMQRVSRSEHLSRAGRLLARLAMGAVDGNGRGTKFPPTALRCASFFGNTVLAAVPDPKGPDYSMGPGQGWTVEDLFLAAEGALEPGEVRDAALELLAEYYERIAAEAGGLDLGSHALAELVADALVRDYEGEAEDGTPPSLWILFMQACYPMSGHLRAALAAGAEKADSQANPFTPWRKVPGTF